MSESQRRDQVSNEKEDKPVSEGIDFWIFSHDNPELSAVQRKEAMKVGDYIRMHWQDFRQWSGEILEDATASPDTREKIRKLLAKEEDPATDKRAVKVHIVEIEKREPHLKIVIEAEGIQKRVDASLFYNAFKPLEDSKMYISPGGNAGFSGPGHYF